MSNPSVEVTIFDTTMRDGAQSLPDENQFRTDSKPGIANEIAELGVDVIEAGFPVTGHDGTEVAAVARTVGNQEYLGRYWDETGQAGEAWQSPVIAGLSRAVPRDIDITWGTVQAALRSRIHTFISTDPDHMAAKFGGKSPAEVLAMGSQAVRIAKALTEEHPDATVEFSAEAASTTDFEYLERVVKEALQQGADIINVPDTVGHREPFWMHAFYAKVIGWVMSSNPNATISSHNHNDHGLAVANTGALVKAAAEYAHAHNATVRVQLETTICGLGERAGNADVFPVAAGLFKFAPDLVVPVHWKFNPENSVRVANAVMGQAGLAVHRQSPIVGSDILVHRSGIHSDGILKAGDEGHRIYTPYDPKFWGHRENAVHEDGLYQGKRGRAAAE